MCLSLSHLGLWTVGLVSKRVLNCRHQHTLVITRLRGSIPNNQFKFQLFSEGIVTQSSLFCCVAVIWTNQRALGNFFAWPISTQRYNETVTAVGPDYIRLLYSWSYDSFAVDRMCLPAQWAVHVHSWLSWYCPRSISVGMLNCLPSDRRTLSYSPRSSRSASMRNDWSRRLTCTEITPPPPVCTSWQ